MIALHSFFENSVQRKRSTDLIRLEGFPTYSQYDELDPFYKYKGKYFDEEFIDKHELFLKTKEKVTGINKFLHRLFQLKVTAVIHPMNP